MSTIINFKTNKDMKKLLLNLTVILMSTIALAQTTSENYSKTTIYQTETTDGSVADDLKNESIIYYDGLGRPIQQIAVKLSPNSKDIINHIEYDEFGRQSKQYLPYASTDSNFGMYRTDALARTQQFYNTSKYENTLNPYSETFFDGTPLNLVVEQSAPGNDWLEGIANEHTIKNEYKLMSNDDLVRWFKVQYSSTTNTSNPSLIYNGYYEVDESQNNYRPPLYKFITKNENWNISDGDDNTTQVFKDYRGRTLLSRSFENGETHDTYYVYDDFGNLVYVVPPLASDQIVDEGDLGFRVASQTNYSWINLVEVDKNFAEEYNKKLSDYNNIDILNADIENEYNGQGGFTVTTFADSEAVTLNISFSATNAFALKEGVLTSLKDYGNYKDTELGRIEGADFVYTFIIKGNEIIIEKSGIGKGEFSAISQNFNSNIKLSYSYNYPWTSYVEVDPEFAADYEKQLEVYPNSDILNVNLQNSYGGQGGLNISIDENDIVTLNINSSLSSSLALKNGIVASLNMKRSIIDRELGSISGNGYYYTFSILDNNLFIRGEGEVSMINTVMTTPNPATVNSASVVGLCYKYIYDDKNRIIEKLTPGKSAEYVVYDRLDRPIMTQNGYQSVQSPKEWSFIKYDALGRVAYTGVIKTNSTRSIIQSSLNTSTLSLFESKASTPMTFSTDPNSQLYYTNNAYPNTGDISLHTINYYDNYNFDTQSLLLADNTSVFDDAIDMNTKSLPTGSKVRVLTTDYWTTSITQYNDKAQVLYVASKNDYLNTTDFIKTDLDFLGKVLETESSHVNGGNNAITTVDQFTYDHAGRNMTHTQTVDSNSEELISSITYDELGQIESKKVGGEASNDPLNSTGLQTVDYKYNIRGWLKSINDGLTSNNDLFGLKLNYNNPEQNNTALFNGNISEIFWQTANDNKQRGYEYNYDALNRIKSATYHGNYELEMASGEFENYSLSDITYDKNGNIYSLKRMGLQVATNQIDVIDDLIYSYAPLSNKLSDLTDLASEDGFKEGNSQGNDYLYDNSGNMIKDLNKGITNIEYNHLSLPMSIDMYSPNYTNDGINGNIKYVYDATGVKLEKRISTYFYKSITDVTTTRYSGNFIYVKNGNLEQPFKLSFFSHPEGYIERNGSGYDYVYQYTDNLGNVRLSYKNIGSESNPILEIVEENNYYPFGLKHQGYNNVVTSSSLAQKWKYNGKEFEEALGLNLYEMDMRQYDPAIARWTSIDPITHHSMSTYTAFDNNPVFWADPSGANSTKSDDIDKDDNAEFDKKWGSTTYYGGSASFDGNGINVSGYAEGADIGRNEDGEVIYVTNGELEVFYHGEDGEEDLVFEIGYIFADDETPIKVYRNVTSNSGADTNCHGVTFADGDFWINPAQVPTILKGDSYVEIQEGDMKTGDIIFQHDPVKETKGNNHFVHSTTVTCTDGTYENTASIGLGGMEITTIDQPVPVTLHKMTKSLKVWLRNMTFRKSTDDKVFNQSQIEKLKESVYGN